MIRTFARQIVPWLLVLAGLATAIGMVATGPRSLAQQADGLCRVGIVIDRSGSVRVSNPDNPTTIRNQIARLFVGPQWSPDNPTGGLFSENIFIAYWSFSATVGGVNYNAPYHDYVDTKVDEDNEFIESLPTFEQYIGSTNYEQGFAHHTVVQGQSSTQTFNSNADIRRIVREAQIIVFLTDGLPNTPSSSTNPQPGSDTNNSYAKQLARNTVVKLKAGSPQTGPGKVIIGGMIGNVSSSNLNEVINGNPANSTNTFRIDEDYADLSRELAQRISTTCDEINPQPERDYDLEPRVETDDPVIADGGSAGFRYRVNNISQADKSDLSEWTVKRLVVHSDQSVQPLLNINQGGKNYHDDYSCDILRERINFKGNCEQVDRGEDVFAPGLSPYLTVNANASTATADGQWVPGTKVCFVLTITQPKATATPKNRFSSAKCTTVGKRPLVQVWGGDLVAGRYFSDGGAGLVPEADIRTSVVTRNINGNTRTYGSWAEYGAFASGYIARFSTMSGLKGGSNDSNQEAWSALTFANTQDIINEFGRFTSAGGSLGTLPDIDNTLLAGQTPDQNWILEEIALGENEPDIDEADRDEIYMYKKTNDNLTINESTIGEGKSIIIHVPDNSVTIAGNITYNDGPYENIGQIPQLIIIAQNIFIDKSVTNVDAWLIADGDSNNGMIVTCNSAVDEDGDVVPFQKGAIEALTSEMCNDQLRINGPIIARTLLLRRTAGAGAVGAPGIPAEILNLRADVYAWSLSEASSNLRIQTSSVKELPPHF